MSSCTDIYFSVHNFEGLLCIEPLPAKALERKLCTGNGSVHNFYMDKPEYIRGGATIWARQTVDSDIFFYKPDKWFKIWFYIVNRVNHRDKGKFKRGEALITYEEIMASTRASKAQVHKCIKYLEKENMIGFQRTTRGMTRKVHQYEKYQSLGNYKDNSETTRETTDGQLTDNSGVLPINKNDKNENNEKNEKKVEPKNVIEENEVGILLELIKETQNIPMLDGTREQNRTAAVLLIRKLKRDGKTSGEVFDFIRAVLERVAQDDFWAGKITSAEKLNYKFMELANLTRHAKQGGLTIA